MEIEGRTFMNTPHNQGCMGVGDHGANLIKEIEKLCFSSHQLLWNL